MTFETLALEREGAVLRLTLNRPERRNAITFQMMRDLTSAFQAIARDRSLRVLVLRGAGGHFCAGGDLGHMLAPPDETGPDPVAGAYRRMGEALRALEALPQAVVAVVEGACVGGGLGMACASDLVIARDTAKFGMPESRAGFIPSQILPTVVKRIGQGQAFRLAVSARVIDGVEAQRIGVVHDLARTDDALEALLRAALQDLAWAEPAAVGEIKRLIRLIATAPQEIALDDAAATISRLLASPEAAEGIRAFQEKRPPLWAEPQSEIDAKGRP